MVESPPKSPDFGTPWNRPDTYDDWFASPFASTSIEHILPQKAKFPEMGSRQDHNESNQSTSASGHSSVWSWCMAPNPGNSCLPWSGSNSATFAWTLEQQIGVSGQQAQCAAFAHSNCVAFFWAAFIICNMLVVVYAVDARAQEESAPDWMHILTIVIIVLYAADVVLRFHLSVRDFFSEFWNVFDVVWVLCEVVAEILDVLCKESSLISLVHAFRLGRIFRIVRILFVFEDVLLLVQSVFVAARKLLWSSFLLAVLLLCCSILAVEFLHPLNIKIADEGAYDNCPRCKHAFQSVPSATLTLFSTVIAGDSWGEVSIPIMEKHPLTAILFFFVFFTMQFCILSLILAVSVDCFQFVQSRRTGDAETSRCHQFELERATLSKLCGGMDDGGTVSLEKFVTAFDNNVELNRFFSLMDIHRKDLVVVFNLCKLMNINGSSEVCFSDFIDELVSLKMMSPQRMLLYSSSSIHSRVSNTMRALWGRTLEMSKEHSKQLKRMADLMSSSLSRKQSFVDTDVANEGQEGSRPTLASKQRNSDVRTPRKKKVPETPHRLHLPISRGQLGEDEVEKCMNRLRQCIEQELNSIAEAVSMKLRQAATSNVQERGGGTFAVVDEPKRSARLSSRPKDSARLQNQIWLAEQVQNDLMKFRDMFNDNAFAYSSKIGSSFPDNDAARDYQIALVQLQLHLNDGLSGAIADVVEKINPTATDAELQNGDFCRAPHTPHRHQADHVGQCGLLAPACSRLIIRSNDSAEQM